MISILQIAAERFLVGKVIGRVIKWAQRDSPLEYCGMFDSVKNWLRFGKLFGQELGTTFFMERIAWERRGLGTTMSSLLVCVVADLRADKGWR